MTISEMEQVITEAKAQLSRADLVATSMARLLVGRLRQVDSLWILKYLKRELSKFDAHTCQWKE